MDTKLHTAVRFGNINGVLEALKVGLDPNQMGLFKWSPVHEAANNGERDILKLLVTNRGDVNLQDKLHGNTPLHYAAREDNSACVTVLLKAGARIDVKNDEGMTCQDVATSLCQEIILEFVNSRNAGNEWPSGVSDLFDNRNMLANGQNESDHKPSVAEQTAIGQLHLSFEYHRMDLKIRVWQVSDLLLPPPQISMIDSVFVRGYFIPDAVKKTNRQTEYVKVESQSKDSTLPLQNGIQHILSPSTFRFETPLLYTGVTQNIVAERSVQLEVCMTQKYTHKAFLMAMVHMPLRTAVKHPIREKYPLIPCMNYTIPNNMRVYSARDIICDKSSYFLNRSPTRSISSQSGFGYPLTTKDTYSDVEEENFIYRTSFELSDSDCDGANVGTNLNIKTSLEKNITPTTRIINVKLLNTDNVDIPGGLREVVGFENTFSNTTKCETAEQTNEENLKPKKKIIPNELLDRTFDSETYFTSVLRDDSKQLTPINKELDIDTNIMKNALLQNNVTVNLVSKATKEDGKHDGILQCPPNGKKKIFPPELFIVTESKESLKPQSNYISSQEVAAHESNDQGCLYDDIKYNNKNSSSTNASDKIHPEIEEFLLMEAVEHHEQSESSEDQACDLMSKISQFQHPSIEIIDAAPYSATVSRPETPIWDFYDFNLEEDAEHAIHETKTGSSKDDASSALGTLQDSILRLTQSSKTLDTCRVIGPVLPTVMIEDFEMDGDDDVDDDKDGDGDDENDGGSDIAEDI